MAGALDVRVLALTYAYPPHHSPRAVQIARLVRHLTLPCRVVCAEDDEAPKDPRLAAHYVDDAPGAVVRVPWSFAARLARTASDKLGRGRLELPDRWRPWQRAAVRAVRRRGLLRDGDVLVTFAMPMSDHVAGLRLARPGVRWIAHFSDPFTDSPFRSDGPAVARLNRRLEARVLATADAVVFTSEETADLVMAKHPPALRSRVRILPHAFDPSLYGGGAPAPDGRVVLRYLGNFYGHRGPGPLLDALEELHRRRPDLLDDATVELVGRTQHDVAEQIARRSLPEGLVALREPVGYLESLELMVGAGVLLVVDAPADRSVFLPSKLVDYLGAGRPIVALTPEGAAARLVREVGGRQADPADPQAAARALEAAITDARAGAGRPDPAVVARYEAAAVAARFEALVADVASR